MSGGSSSPIRSTLVPGDRHFSAFGVTHVINLFVYENPWG